MLLGKGTVACPAVQLVSHFDGMPIVSASTHCLVSRPVMRTDSRQNTLCDQTLSLSVVALRPPCRAYLTPTSARTTLKACTMIGNNTSSWSDMGVFCACTTHQLAAVEAALRRGRRQKCRPKYFGAAFFFFCKLNDSGGFLILPAFFYLYCAVSRCHAIMGWLLTQKDWAR